MSTRLLRRPRSTGPCAKMTPLALRPPPGYAEPMMSAIEEWIRRMKRLVRKPSQPPQPPEDPYSYVTAPKKPRPPTLSATAVAELPEK
jgi:hypothetical protein